MPTEQKVKPYSLHGILTTTFDDNVEVEELVYYSTDKDRVFFKYQRRDFSKFDCQLGRCLRFPCNTKGEVFSNRMLGAASRQYWKRFNLPASVWLKDVNAAFLMKGTDLK